ncbi:MULTISPECIES: hypothetical protein [Nitrosomonas]|uniref:Uncharacterized protein n=1 Tax=Nitrosomonas communis TaxID=44574 RepID=A0A0F7KCC4_9PROT|nr:MULTISPECIES: hypothetical protein [Nitrosomonas]AKH38175.1 hypothetical protein AAW31_10825 [Nitrosomonas communis]TYP91149.1 hypothetical protein BCL69_101155 [Nitrosomonas communis]UVS60135.1 hypothetical protein NX761_11430 [Nitrosomonas sp. PLL12]
MKHDAIIAANSVLDETPPCILFCDKVLKSAETLNTILDKTLPYIFSAFKHETALCLNFYTGSSEKQVLITGELQSQALLSPGPRFTIPSLNLTKKELIKN